MRAVSHIRRSHACHTLPARRNTTSLPCRQPQFYEGVTLSEYNDLRARHIITPYGFSAEPLAPAAAPDGSPQSNAAAPGTADPPAVLSSGAVVNAPFTRVDPCRAG